MKLKSLAIGVIGIGIAVGVLYLISKRPQNLTKKAPVFKKTHIVPSPKNCYSNGSIVALEKMRIPIFLYHYVEYVKDKKDKKREIMSTHPDIFESQVNTFLKNNYTTIFVKEIPEILSGVPYSCLPSVALTFDDGYSDFYTDVFPILKKYHVKATVYIITNYINKKGFLNKKQIRELIQSRLVEIGSHTMDHADLTETTVDQSRQQIINSKKMLEETFGIEIKTFSYPYGKYNAFDLNLVKEASYSAAVSIAEGVVQSKDEEFSLKRVRPEKFLDKDIIEELKKYQK